MRCISGANVFFKKSNGGAIGLCVPPVIVTVDDSLAAHNAGRTVWRTRVVLPALLIANS